MNDNKEKKEWECPDHGRVRATERQHGGRARARVCPEAGCTHTVTNITVDWEAYDEARSNDQLPPCPECDSNDVNKVPASPPLRCRGCGHVYGYAGAYY